MDKKIIAAITFVIIVAFSLTIVETVAQMTTSKPDMGPNVTVKLPEESKMTKFLILWRVDSQTLPANPDECLKLLQETNEWMKAEMASGHIKDYGEYVDGSGGYAIAETDDITKLYGGLMEFWPYVEFDAKPVITIDQTIDWTNKIIAKRINTSK
jgi:hypothetical protein